MERWHEYDGAWKCYRCGNMWGAVLDPHPCACAEDQQQTGDESRPAAWRAEKNGEVRFIQPRAWFYAESGYRQRGWTVTPLYESPPSSRTEPENEG